MENYSNKVTIELPSENDEFTDEAFKDQVNSVMDTFIQVMDPEAHELTKCKNSLRFLSIIRDSSTQLKSIISIMILSIFTLSCAKVGDGISVEESTNNQLEGFWTISSVKETGTELIDRSLSSAAIKFEKTTKQSGQFTLLYYELGSSQEYQEKYSYTVTSATTLSSSELDVISISLTFGLKISFTNNGQLYVIQAR